MTTHFSQLIINHTLFSEVNGTLSYRRHADDKMNLKYQKKTALWRLCEVIVYTVLAVENKMDQLFPFFSWKDPF